MSISYPVPKTNLFAVAANGTYEQNSRLPAIDWTLVRRARPLDRLLPATLRWSYSLPDGFRPDELLKAYPRVANCLAIAWGDPRAVEEVMNDILIDRRGGRQGFPPRVMAELMHLRSLACRI